MLLRGRVETTLQALIGTGISKWIDIELPRVQNPRLDLLGQATNGSLVHIELQSTNDPQMALRMLEYCSGVYRFHGSFPRQIVLYVGEPQMKMPSELNGHGLSFRYEAIDFREVDGERLLASHQVGDNVLAILAKLRDRDDAVHRIIGKISSQEISGRETALEQLMILAGLRKLEKTVAQEITSVPILNDILDHEVLGPKIKRARAEGREEGRKGEVLTLLCRLIEKRFGPVPVWVEPALTGRSVTELEEFSVRVIDAPSLNDLLR